MHSNSQLAVLPSNQIPIHSSPPTSSPTPSPPSPLPNPISPTPLSNPIPTAAPSGNIHPMQTRAKSGIHKPKAFLTSKEPTSISEALQHEPWIQAMRDELFALDRNQTWPLFPLPPDRKIIGCKWVFKLKENPDGTINKHKARLVAKGFHQVPGFDFTETFSPVVKPTTIRIILSLALTNQWDIRQLNVNNVFLNGDLHEEVFMAQPPGFKIAHSPPLVCKLHKALYGLR